MDKVRNRIRVILSEKELTNLWLAEKLGKSPNTVSRWVTNAAQPPLQVLFDISKALKVDIRDLLEPSL